MKVLFYVAISSDFATCDTAAPHDCRIHSRLLFMLLILLKTLVLLLALLLLRLNVLLSRAFSLDEIGEAAHENEPRLAVPSCHGRR